MKSFKNVPVLFRCFSGLPERPPERPSGVNQAKQAGGHRPAPVASAGEEPVSPPPGDLSHLRKKPRRIAPGEIVAGGEQRNVRVGEPPLPGGPGQVRAGGGG